MAAPIAAVPDPQDEPVVLTVEGQNLVVYPDDPAYPVAAWAADLEVRLRATEQSHSRALARITVLQTEQKDKAARERATHVDRERVAHVFETYRVESGRKRCKLTPERFDLIIERNEEDYDWPFLLMAAIGIATNPFVIDGEARNDFETAFKEGSQVERYANRCPAERRRQITAESETPQ